MSDPVTNAEVEDVLSSIRRLVSDENRPGSATKAAAQHERLVLTQALRVAPDESDDTSSTLDTFVLRDAIVPEDRDNEAPEAAFEGEADPIVADATANETPEDGEAALQEDDLAPQQDTSTEMQEPQPIAEDATAQPTAASALSAKIAALETAIGNISGEWEPDAPGEDDYSGTQAPAMTWQDDVELDATGHPVAGTTSQHDAPPVAPPSPSQSAAPQATSIAGTSAAELDEVEDGDQFLDEEALRDLVAEIVRSELQGELGARITRNVRKLVRREIHRALAAKELE